MGRKVTYKPRNWPDYNKSLIQRGSLFLWVSQETISEWEALPVKQRGAPRKYSDTAVRAILQLKFLFNMSLRAVQGLFQSLFDLLKLDLPVPNYSTLSRRLCLLDNKINADNVRGPVSLAIDSSGLKVYGEGEWKVRTHGYSKRRTWRKFHLAVDVSNQLIRGVTVTTNDFQDSEVFKDTISQISNPITDIIGDGAYDKINCYAFCQTINANPIFPPRKDAVIHHPRKRKAGLLARNKIIKAIRRQGEQIWKNKTGYHRRSLAESVMFRFKKQFTGDLKSRIFENQASEILIKCEILNQFTKMGLARSLPH